MIGGWFSSLPPRIDEAGREDFAELAELHSLSFSREWSEEEIAALMAGDGVFALVTRRGAPTASRRPIGFVLVRAVADEAEILTIAVHPRWRGRGHGKRLMEAAMRRLYGDRVLNVFLEVDAGNASARGLYDRLGFKVVGERKGYYHDGDGGPSTALVMRYTMTPPARPKKQAVPPSAPGGKTRRSD
ncbi:ribosomal-protein-alanine N-acetyltransferase [Breoghania corrubedonensis]|uniref:Ribosomal-protein-alanine N-acetyltransferase n=1 Tax=Breoghania corrubedonensis TaxID=665038 RepID=A0A2T5VGZ0_9HYPH|nr:GNAT family N-acetyltransferase [Breoghania corrubedonensis]PTW63020.1 ribosomal-protein-alanine N-acetyltransferase [Breoghania corrubedonensis]